MKLVLQVAAGYVIGALIMQGIEIIEARIAMRSMMQEMEIDAKRISAASIDAQQQQAHADFLAGRKRLDDAIRAENAATWRQNQSVKEAKAKLAASKGLQPPRPLLEGERCVSGTIVKVDLSAHSAIQVLENQQPIMCE